MAGGKLDLGHNIFIYFLDWLIVILYMQFIAVNIKNLLVKKTSWKLILGLHLFFYLILGVVLQLSTDFAKWTLGIMPDFNYSGGIQKFIYYMDLDFLTYFSMVFIIYSYYYFEVSREGEQQQNNLQTQLITAKMKMLTAQIQPHFLFNTINCIISLIEKNPRKAQDTLIDLSDFFRAITRFSESHFITVEEEVRILKYYLSILKVRFQENLTIIEDIDEKLFPELIPAVSLQPLIENAISHGYSYGHEELTIKISILSDHEYIFLSVENNGKLIEDNSDVFRKGIGLTNTLERLQNLYKNDFSFIVRNKSDNSGVENIIKIPLNSPITEANFQENIEKMSLRLERKI